MPVTAVWSFTHRKAWWNLPGSCLLALGQSTPGGLLRPQESSPTCSWWGRYIFQLVGIEKSVRETCSGGSEVLPQICISTPRSQQDLRPRQPPGPVAPAPPALAGTPLPSKSVFSSSRSLVRAAARLRLWPPPPSVPTPHHPHIKKIEIKNWTS